MTQAKNLTLMFDFLFFTSQTLFYDTSEFGLTISNANVLYRHLFFLNLENISCNNNALPDTVHQRFLAISQSVLTYIIVMNSNVSVFSFKPCLLWLIQYIFLNIWFNKIYFPVFYSAEFKCLLFTIMSLKPLKMFSVCCQIRIHFQLLNCLFLKCYIVTQF